MASPSPLPTAPIAAPPARDGDASVAEVAKTFAWLGLTSFGGPIAHLGYFRREFVERRRWLDEAEFGQLLAICQLLPGPTSSQLGFVVGMHRAGWAGAIAAFASFTLPSAALMFAFAWFSLRFAGPAGDAAVKGLMLVAVAVVAQGVLAMARSLAPDWPRRAMAICAAALAILGAGMPMTSLLLVAAGALVGSWVCRPQASTLVAPVESGYGTRIGAALLATFGLLLGLAMATGPGQSLATQVAAAFFRAGAMVFGGGHVVLPMLERAVVSPGWLTESDFLAGYGAAQAVPGPLFSFAAFLGERLPGGVGGIAGAALATFALFLPGLLLVSGVLPFWKRIGSNPQVSAAIAGVNAVVVGVLAGALYDPVCTHAITRGADLAIAVVAIVALIVGRWPSLAIVALCVGLSLATIPLS